MEESRRFDAARPRADSVDGDRSRTLDSPIAQGSDDGTGARGHRDLGGWHCCRNNNMRLVGCLVFLDFVRGRMEAHRWVGCGIRV